MSDRPIACSHDFSGSSESKEITFGVTIVALILRSDLGSIICLSSAYNPQSRWSTTDCRSLLPHPNTPPASSPTTPQRDNSITSLVPHNPLESDQVTAPESPVPPWSLIVPVRSIALLYLSIGINRSHIQSVAAHREAGMPTRSVQVKPPPSPTPP